MRAVRRQGAPKEQPPASFLLEGTDYSVVVRLVEGGACTRYRNRPQLCIHSCMHPRSIHMIT